MVERNQRWLLVRGSEDQSSVTNSDILLTHTFSSISSLCSLCGHSLLCFRLTRVIAGTDAWRSLPLEGKHMLLLGICWNGRCCSFSWEESLGYCTITILFLYVWRAGYALRVSIDTAANVFLHLSLFAVKQRLLASPCVASEHKCFKLFDHMVFLERTLSFNQI